MRISDWSSDVCSSDLQTFVVQSRDPRLQGGIEFGQYAQLVSANLVREGYRPATNPAQADLVVNMGYHVDTGREKLVNDLIGGPNRYGWGLRRYRRIYFYGFHDPFFHKDVPNYFVTPKIGRPHVGTPATNAHTLFPL